MTIDSGKDDAQQTLRRWILAFCVITLVITLFLVANARTWYQPFTFPLSYLLLILSTLLILFKKRMGFFLLLLTSFFWALQLTPDFGFITTFRKYDGIGILFISIPFFIFLVLIPLTAKYLYLGREFERMLVLIALAIAVAFPAYAFIDRLDEDYASLVYAEYRIKENNTVEITIKPMPADTKKFKVEVASEELIDLLKSEGVPFSNYYYNSGTGVFLNYKSDELQSLRLVKIGKKNVETQIVWSASEISGDTSFLIY